MITLALPLAAVALLAQTRTATVLSIGDGDTLRVREGNRTLNVRLACIDAPESSQAPFGSQARQQLQALAPVGSSVELLIKATDRYGRSVAELTSGGRNLNQALVSYGVAFVYWQYIAGCDRQTYGQLETEARLKRLGVWSVKGGLTRPWDYRSNQAAPPQAMPGTTGCGSSTAKQASAHAHCRRRWCQIPARWQSRPTARRSSAPAACCGGRGRFIPSPGARSPTAPPARPGADRCA